LQILRDRQSLRIQALEQRILGLTAADALDRRRRGDVGRCQPRQVDFPEARLRRHRALFGRTSIPALGFNKILQHAIAALVQLTQTQLCLHLAALGQRAKHPRGIGSAALRMRVLGTLEGGRLLLPAPEQLGNK
jgi:hypothetical protein